MDRNHRQNRNHHYHQSGDSRKHYQKWNRDDLDNRTLNDKDDSEMKNTVSAPPKPSAATINNNNNENNPSVHNRGGKGNQMGSGSRKPEQQFYVAKHNNKETSKLADRLNFSETRDMHNNNNVQSEKNYPNNNKHNQQVSNRREYSKNQNYNCHDGDRQRDSRSMESSYSSRDTRKPPSGRRNSNSSDKGGNGNYHSSNRLPLNFESLPPRLQKKLLEDNGLPLSLLNSATTQNSHNDNHNHYNSPQQGWSQTLPHQGGNFRRNKNNHNQNDNYRFHEHNSYNNRRSHSRGSNRSHDDYDFRSSNRSLNANDESFPMRRPYERRRTDSEYSNDTFPNYSRSRQKHHTYKARDQRDTHNLSQEQLNNNTNVDRCNNGNPRGRNSAMAIDTRKRGFGGEGTEFRKPYSHNHQRQRNHSQSSIPNSRDNSQERSYRSRQFHNSSLKNSYDYNIGSRDSSMDRQSVGGGADYRKSRSERNSRTRNRHQSQERRQWSSRENSADSAVYRQDEVTRIQSPTRETSIGHNWRKTINIDREFENISNQISTLNMETHKDEVQAKVPGIIQLPKSMHERPNNRNHDVGFRAKHGNHHGGYQQKLNFNQNSTSFLKSENQGALEKFSIPPPSWYDKNSQAYRDIRDSTLIDNLIEIDSDLQELIVTGRLIKEWDTFMMYRKCVQTLLQRFLVEELKFCANQSVENHIWKLLYYNVIELLKTFSKDEELSEESKQMYKTKTLEIIDDGLEFFEKLTKVLEDTYKFSISDYVGMNAPIMTKGLRLLGVALVSTQKVFLSLGDLARYREELIDSGNFGIARQWYTKAQQITPSNGRPYYLLGMLSVKSKRKVDAVYYYMRNLMSSNPSISAKENLMTLFDEIRKKYESSQKKRDEKNRKRLKEKECKFGGPLRRETWIHPDGGRRIHRTTPLDLTLNKNGDTSDEEELEAMSNLDLNKRFITSYLHVHGKLITRIGMETFTQCTVQMMREFRTLLRVRPIPITQLRLLQLTALNMFAIQSTQLKDPNLAPGPRSSVQESAISVALMMFGLILEKFVILLKEILNTNTSGVRSERNDNKESDDGVSKGNGGSIDGRVLLLNEDARVLLPSIKIWCDWLLKNSHVWNPPPSCGEYKIGVSTTQYDPWTKLAQLVMLLESVDAANDLLWRDKESDDYVPIRLEEDITLAGFTPLFSDAPLEIYCHCDVDKGIAQTVLRMKKILFVASKFLCECEPPVLRRVSIEDPDCDSTMVEKAGSNKITHEYICVVQNRNDESGDESDFLLESYSEDELHAKIVQRDSGEVELRNEKKESDCQLPNGYDDGDDRKSEVRKLLLRKDELERSHKMQEKRHQRYQDILRQSSVQVHIEVRPKYLIPDTNCFVDFMESLQLIADSYPLFQLLVPLVVVNELDGLSKGNRLTQFPDSQTDGDNSVMIKGIDNDHAKKVAESSKLALSFLKSKKNPGVKWVTTKGSILTPSIFTTEDETTEQMSNDDKILTTAIQLCRANDEQMKDGTRFINREVVLLTTDRNLRVKSLSRDVPVRELPDFIRWAAL